MSEPKRYFLKLSDTFRGVRPDVYEHKDGMFVDYDDYARLKAEVEAWKDMVADSGVACNERARENQDLENQIKRLKAEVERLTAFTTRTIIPNEELKAQVERLTKAGDAMSREVDPYVTSEDLMNKVRLWNAAKQGKPHA
jgi:septal ring factor EnvC (AmiA/AmiB activator)